MAKKLVIMEQKDFAKLVTQVNHVENKLRMVGILAKDVEEIDAIKEIIKSMENHVSTIQNILEKED